jgi:creatinine amidohydrolase
MAVSLRMSLVTWRDVEQYLRGSRLVLVPIGSTEQHGPNGLLGTDWICAEAIAARAAEHVSALVAPTINVGMALHHMAFPGTISLRPETLMAVIRDVVESLYRHGFRAVMLVNGHGGNIATGQAALSGLREDFPDLRLDWVNWWQAGPSMDELLDAFFHGRHGSHATPSEISVTMAVHPEAVQPIPEPMDVEVCRDRGMTGSSEFRRLYPDGRVGSDPSLAARDRGEALIDEAARLIGERAAELARQVAPIAVA